MMPPALQPERLDLFMARANAIYYGTHDPFADFTTSPEISQVFGEILGLWAVVTWQLLGRPDPVMLVEAGPGRGTLMTDALRAIRRAAPNFARALVVHLIETSRRLRAVQASRVPDAIWHDSLETVPNRPMILLANEFLDALPIRQFVRRGSGWAERFVDMGQTGVGKREAGQTEVDQMTVSQRNAGPKRRGQWIERPVDTAEVPAGRAAAEGDVVEVNQPARSFVAAIGERLAGQPGAALFLDYGPEQSAAGDSLQALAQKRPVDPLVQAGLADLTAHVDFADLADVACACGAAVQGPLAQGAFLTALGLIERTARLALDRTPAEAAALIEGTRRLAEPAAMGHLFKVLAVRSAGCPPLPGLPS